MAVPKCPKCATELRDDYGMVNCPGCSAIVFVDMEGNAHVANEGEQSSGATEPFDTPSFSPATPSESEVAEPLSFEPAPLEAPMEPIEPAPFEAPAEEQPPVDLDMNAFLGYGGSEGSTAEGGGGQSQIDPNDPLGISAYANSEISAAKDGPLVVSLIISGIDTKDLRTDVREALQDSRFGWDATTLMGTIKGGVLRIDQISPVKATVIVNRIKNLAVQIRWEQNAITGINLAENEAGKEP